MSDGGRPYNNNVHQFPKRKNSPPHIFSPIDWQDKKPEPIEWLVQGCIPKRTVVLFSGDSGLGKSLLMQQLQTSCAIGRPWLGHEVQSVKSLGFYCEDPNNILHWRQLAICQSLDVDISDLEDMAIIERVGMDNTLMDFNRRTDDNMATSLFTQLKRSSLEFGAQLTIIDTAAHTFGGNENVRQHVTAFVAGLQEIANETDGAVVLCAHPSVSSMQSGTGYSGSTAWRASVRAHMYLKRPKGYDDEDPDADHDTRLLKTMKSNWGPGSGLIKLKWDNGVFIAVENERKSAFGKVEQLKCEAAILGAVRYFLKKDQRIAVSPQAARTYIIKMLETMPSCREYERNTLVNTVDRLEADGRLVKVELGPPSGRAMFYRTPELKYPGEK
jgi:RecA-family ATPase